MVYNIKYRNIFILLFVVLILASCSARRLLQYKLNRDQYPLGYLHDSPVQKNKIQIAVFPERIELPDTINPTIVVKPDGHFYFLKALFKLSCVFTIKLGENSLTPQLESFINNSFIKESERSGIFLVNDSSVIKKYNLKLEILEHFVETYYMSNSVSMGTRTYSSITPALAHLKLKALLYDSDNELVFSKDYESDRKENFLNTVSRSERDLNFDLMQNMTEVLSGCVKENIAEMVSDINSYFDESGM